MKTAVNRFFQAFALISVLYFVANVTYAAMCRFHCDITVLNACITSVLSGFAMAGLVKWVCFGRCKAPVKKEKE